ncbi:hypothetical protein HF292_007460 [Acidithiobacillus ferruginosus]|uniref:Uncharacterized protein n=1 Tax=Acidithiobacillus ferruginosus TaxID=3063951 RepID=A0ACD5IPI0_9PROT|nr:MULTISPECIES: hypothetical protein [Acidithiobacillus]MBU2814249.1 hypothetical protein [Acidithiobacillus ferruginosus]MBU2837204.1 hypothetical protein [Acidithiobacillus thiooxidans]
MMVDYEYKTPSPLWALHDQFTVLEAAMLHYGVDPKDDQWDSDFAGRTFDNAHTQVEIISAAIKKAVTGGKLKASIRYPIHWVENSAWGITEEVLATTWPNMRYMLTGEDHPPEEDRECIVVVKSPDWNKTTIEREDLREWLRSRGVTNGFFFSEAERQGEPEYLNPKHPHYALKLAALVRAWEYVSNTPDYERGKSVKQRIEKWLTVNAESLGLADEEGMPRKGTIQDISPIANWDTKGGAPTTQNGTTP